MRQRELRAAAKRTLMSEDVMSAEDVKMALAALELDKKPHKVARIFNVAVRSVWRWQVDGAPPHITLAFVELLSGRIPPKGIRYYLKRIGRSRNDSRRYGRQHHAEV